MKLIAYLVDDEPLALDRLNRLLEKTGHVEIAGSTTDPESALDFLSRHPVDVLFLDIQMPGLTGFELLARLERQPAVVFTTAYDQYALKAFEVNSIDYLLKPIDPKQLDRALMKLEQLRGTPKPAPDMHLLLEQLAAGLRKSDPDYPDKIASRIGERVCFVELRRVTHFYAQDKLTYAVAAGKSHCVDHSISELERKLDPKRFIRIHRATLLNTDWVKEVAPLFAGSYVVKLNDEKSTELTVARDRVRDLKTRLGW